MDDANVGAAPLIRGSFALVNGRVRSLARRPTEPRGLHVYEARWQAQLGPHLRISSCIRRLFTKLADHEIDRLLGALMSDDVQSVIRQTVRFNWHGELIRAILRQPGVKSVLFHALLR